VDIHIDESIAVIIITGYFVASALSMIPAFLALKAAKLKNSKSNIHIAVHEAPGNSEVPSPKVFITDHQGRQHSV